MKKRKISMEEVYRLGQIEGFMSAMRVVNRELIKYNDEHKSFLRFFNAKNIRKVAQEQASNPFKD